MQLVGLVVFGKAVMLAVNDNAGVDCGLRGLAYPTIFDSMGSLVLL